jgi:hypothetical protein
VSARLLDQRDGPALGILEWFRPGEHARVEAAVADLERLGVRHLRTGVSWADYHRPGVAAWRPNVGLQNGRSTSGGAWWRD